MTSSETRRPEEVFVWTWLPGATEPVVAGVLTEQSGLVSFTYGRTYQARDEAIPLYLPELPLQAGVIPPRVGTIAGCISDAAPDAWGMRVILNRLLGRDTDDVDLLDTFTYLLESGSDRIGALDFQASSEVYVPRGVGAVSLDELARAAELVVEGVPLSAELDQALLHGSSIGGARPKAGLRDGERDLIAKFSSTSDVFPVVKGEFVAMELARRAGLSVAPVELTSALGKDVVLIERFDRPAEGQRRAMVSALTILELDESTALWGSSYAALAGIIRQRFTEPDTTLRELFSRITFNILVGNNDDHPRNHAAFWDGQQLTLTPAYDISPQVRGGNEQQQLMAIGDDGWRMSQLEGCVERAGIYHLSDDDARDIIDRQVDVIESQWEDVAGLARLSDAERAYFWHRQFLNDYAFYGYRPRS
jgi:serine/threonine-protein kinase HipA